MKTRTLIVSLLLAFLCAPTFAKKSTLIERIEPASWWSDMFNSELQIMLYGKDIAHSSVSFTQPEMRITQIKSTSNPNYLFVYVDTHIAQPGNYTLTIAKGKEKQTINYRLEARRKESANRTSFTSADAIYLIMPDRFVNGDTSNDQIKGYVQGINRNDGGSRHGGDIQGIINAIPYIADLGVTAVWTTPLFDNNDSLYSYHHYACSDYYKIDPRFGKNSDYKRLSDSCKAHDLKLIIDVVPNHCGTSHWWLNDIPDSTWFNTWPSFTNSNYRLTAWTDPHASDYDKTILTKGWFAPNMPDFNLDNPLLFDYLRQVYTYWIEYANIDGIRVDTYPYNNINTASRFIKEIRQEYPNMSVVGECWVDTPVETAYFQEGTPNKDGFNSHLQSVMDFVLKNQFEFAFNEEDGWHSGCARFYAHYASDIVYSNPNFIMNFLDNHDIDRYAAVVGHDLRKFKMGLAGIMTTRGYPQIYYGTEIMMDGERGSYEGHRHDFPGGWKEDTRNAFNRSDRTEQENNAFDYLRTLLHYRKHNPVLHTGAMKQFMPFDGFYVYFRYNADKCIMVAFNNSESTKHMPLERFKEMNILGKTAKDITNGNLYPLIDTIEIEGKQALILEINY